MIIPGLVSITFRKLTPEQIIELVVQAGAPAVEWGGDVHVPHGDLDQARKVKQLCEDAGVATPSYGSYYRVAVSETEGLAFKDVLATAKALGVETIRVWSGNKGSANADPEFRKVVMDDLRRIGDMAATEGITISLEYHAGTLTDTNESAQQLLNELDHSNVLTYWQPPNHQTFEYRLDGLKEVLPLVSNLHVFHWESQGNQNIRRPFAEGIDTWKEYFRTVATTGKTYYALMEFVMDDSTQQFIEDAETLKKLLETIK